MRVKQKIKLTKNLSVMSLLISMFCLLSFIQNKNTNLILAILVLSNISVLSIQIRGRYIEISKEKEE